MAVKGTYEEMNQLIREIPGPGGWVNEESYRVYRGVGLWMRGSNDFKDNAEIVLTLKDLYWAALEDVEEKS